MENDMSNTHEYFQKELRLDKKTSEAIKILMDEGLLEPLLVDLRNALEAEEYQNTTSGIKLKILSISPKNAKACRIIHYPETIIP